MVNRYPAPCRFCGGTVLPDSGEVEKVGGGAWRVAHPSCMKSGAGIGDALMACLAPKATAKPKRSAKQPA